MGAFVTTCDDFSQVLSNCEDLELHGKCCHFCSHHEPSFTDTMVNDGMAEPLTQLTPLDRLDMDAHVQWTTRYSSSTINESSKSTASQMWEMVVHEAWLT